MDSWPIAFGPMQGSVLCGNMAEVWSGSLHGQDIEGRGLLHQSDLAFVQFRVV